MRLVSQFLKHVLPGVVRPLHILWNEVIGFVFLVLAVWIGFGTYRRARDLSGDFQGLIFLVGAIILTCLLAYYGISSFRRARKISRS